MNTLQFWSQRIVQIEFNLPYGIKKKNEEETFVSIDVGVWALYRLMSKSFDLNKLKQIVQKGIFIMFSDKCKIRKLNILLFEFTDNIQLLHNVVNKD